MWEEDIMIKKVWDIPNFSGCNKWSDDGMLAILTANSIQVLTPTFDREKFYHARWIQLEHVGENEGSSKKPKSASTKEPYTVSTGNDLIHWMTEVNRCEDRTFGKLDVNSLYFIKAVWGPPGLVMCLPSYLSALLSDGSVLLLAMGGVSQSNHQIYNNGRKSISNLFSMTITLNIATLFDVWMEKNGEHIDGRPRTEQKRKSKTAASDSDSGSDDNNGTKNDMNSDDGGEGPSRGWKCIITEIASYPHLLSYMSPLGNQSKCMLLATGSSSGYVNIWAIQEEYDRIPLTQGKDLRAVCVCSALLAEPKNSSSYTSQQDSGHRILSVTCMEFMVSIEICESSFQTRLLCGSYGGYFMIFDITSDGVNSSKSKKNSSKSSSSSSNITSTSNGNKRDLPSLRIAQPIRVFRPFKTPIESIVISSNEQNTVYLRSAARLVRVDLSTGTISQLDNIHSHVLSTVSVIEKRSYTEQGSGSGSGSKGDLLATCSLDGDVKLWEQSGTILNNFNYINNANNNFSNNYNIGIDNNEKNVNDNDNNDNRNGDDTRLLDSENSNKGVLVILDENCAQPLLSQNHDLNFIQLFEMNKCYAGHPIIDLTFDPLQLILMVTCIIPSTISDSREVQMNKNLEKAHCGISFFLSPILSLKWVVDSVIVQKIIRSAIFPMTKNNVCGEFKSVKYGMISKNSSNGNKNKNCNIENKNKNKNENENGKYYHNNTGEFLINRSSFCGLPFAWLRSFNEVVTDLARADPRTVPDVLTLDQLEKSGIIKEKKKGRGKKDKDDDDDGEVEDDSLPGRAGISDVAWRIKDLLYPNVDVLFHSSLHLVIDACIIVSADLSSTNQDNDINVYDVNPVTGGGFHRQLLSIPTEGKVTLYRIYGI